MSENLLASLNEAQRQAVEYIDGPELVIAGAGSGKTRVLTYKVAHLLNLGVAPERIMALTFTNKAAREMKERIAAMVSPEAARRLWMGTFHSILLRILRRHADRLGFRHDFTIYDTTDSRSLVKLIIQELGLNDKQYKPASIAAAISNAKNALISPEKYESDAGTRQADTHNGQPMLGRIYRMYCQRCRLAQAMDFDDILYYANVLLRDNADLTEHYSHWFEYVLVDEYQDTNFAQSLIVHRLTKAHGRLCAVGDDAQSIYAFRGANIANILGMKERYPDLHLFKLERNYRSTKNIVGAAGSLIRHNRGQIPKEVYSENETGDKLEVMEAYNDMEEAAFVAGAVTRRLRLSSGSTLEDMAILYRTNAQSRALEEALRRRAIPYRIYGGLTFYQRKEVKDALAYFRLAVNPDDDEALRRIINIPARGIGDTTMKKVRSLAMEKNIPMWSVVSNPEGTGLSVNKGTATKLKSFAEMIEAFHKEAEKVNAYELGQDIYNRTGLLAMYAHSSTPEEISKHENLSELLSGLREFVERPSENEEQRDMGLFLSEVSLLTDQDAEEEDNESKITLMTVHSAKGLEFDHVFITGLEENLFPSAMAIDSPAEIEEERRLLYVAITRARKSVVMSYANQRFRNGSVNDTIPSRFLEDIDLQYLTGHIRRRGSFFSSQRPTSFSTPTMPDRRQDVFRNDSSYSVARPRKLSPVKRDRKPSTVSSTPADMPYQPGMRIRHNKFGIGTVEICIKDPEPMLEVNFDDFGNKKIILRFANLTIEND